VEAGKQVRWRHQGSKKEKKLVVQTIVITDVRWVFETSKEPEDVVARALYIMHKRLEGLSGFSSVSG